jgi:hypothetical protein
MCSSDPHSSRGSRRMVIQSAPLSGSTGGRSVRHIDAGGGQQPLDVAVDGRLLGWIRFRTSSRRLAESMKSSRSDPTRSKEHSRGTEISDHGGCAPIDRGALDDSRVWEALSVAFTAKGSHQQTIHRKSAGISPSCRTPLCPSFPSNDGRLAILLLIILGMQMPPEERHVEGSSPAGAEARPASTGSGTEQANTRRRSAMGGFGQRSQKPRSWPYLPSRACRLPRHERERST